MQWYVMVYCVLLYGMLWYIMCLCASNYALLLSNTRYANLVRAGPSMTGLDTPIQGPLGQLASWLTHDSRII